MMNSISWRSKVAVFMAHGGSQALGLGRNVILARALGPADMGTATLFALCLTCLEMMSDIGPEKLLIQSRSGPSASLRASSHGVLVIRSALVALLILGSHSWIASSLGLPSSLLAFGLLSVIVVLRGLQHLEVKARQRELRFGGWARGELLGHAAAAAAAFPVVAVTGDFTAVLWCALIQSAVTTLSSHLVARETYSIGFTGSDVERIVRYGWPLALNGGLVFAVLQGDRLILGIADSTEAVGRYSIAFGLAMIPSLIAARVIGTLLLPTLSRAKDASRFQKLLRSAAIPATWVGFALGSFLVVAGTPLIELLYGVAFSPPAAMTAVLGGWVLVRMVREVQSAAAMASAKTQIPLQANLVRFIGVAGAAIVAVSGFGMTAVAGCGLVGECLAAIAGAALLRRRSEIPLSITLWPMALSLVALTGVAGLAMVRADVAWVAALIGVAAGALLAVVQRGKIRELSDVVDGHLCTGCGTCAGLLPKKIKMEDTEDRGRRPQMLTSLSKSDDQTALSSCPGTGQSRPAVPEDAIPELTRDFGPVLEVWEGHATDPEIRYRGSSGGVVTALAVSALDHGMEGVAHVQAREEAPLLNRAAFSRTRDELTRAAGSRYAPASPNEALPEIEAAERPCVLIGKPCDITAADKARKIRPALDRNLGLTIAIFCAGTPTNSGTRALLRRLGAGDPKDVTKVRYRGNGWPGMMTVENRGGESKSIPYDRGWGEVLQKHRQWRCHVCADHTGELADISVGDPWYRERVPGEEGRSLILIRTERGRRMFRDAMREGTIAAERRDSWVVPASQRHLVHARGAVFGRALVSRWMGAAAPSFPGLETGKTWLRQLSLSEKFSSVVGTARRVVRKRLLVVEPTSTSEWAVPAVPQARRRSSASPTQQPSPLRSAPAVSRR